MSERVSRMSLLSYSMSKPLLIFQSLVSQAIPGYVGIAKA